MMKPVGTTSLWCGLLRVFDVPFEFLLADVCRRESNMISEPGSYGTIRNGDQRVSIDEDRIPCVVGGHLDEVVTGVVLGSLAKGVDILLE